VTWLIITTFAVLDVTKILTGTIRYFMIIYENYHLLGKFFMTLEMI
jgi:hypothetical protein